MLPNLGQRMDTHFISISKFFLVIIVVLFGSCQGERFIRNQPNFVDNNATVNITPTSNDQQITVHYIGCSGFFIQKGESTILIDPFFSYRVGLRTRLIDENNIGVCLQNIIDNVFTKAIGSKNDDKGKIDALLISHAHIDHLGDVPYLIKSKHLDSTIHIIGNTTVGHYIKGNGITSAKIDNNVEGQASSWLSAGDWVNVCKRTPSWGWVEINQYIRVLPIVSEHGPHMKINGHKLNFAPGKHEMEDIKYRRPLRYGTGQTLSFLIDFLNPDGTVNFRIYHSSASCNAPFGFPPASVLAEHGVDLQILCAASFNQVSNYPEDIIRYLKPRHILISHWENFVVSSYAGIKKHPHANSIYNYRKFFKRLNQVLHDLNNDRRPEDQIQYTLPNVDTKIEFKYYVQH